MTLADSSVSARAALFVYGTLQVPQVVQAVLQRLPRSQPAVLSGYRCGLMAGQCYPGIVAAPGQRVRGRLLVALTWAELCRLDVYEGDEYQRVEVCVELSDERAEAGARAPARQIRAQAYVVKPQLSSRVTSAPFEWKALGKQQLRELLS